MHHLYAIHEEDIMETEKITINLTPVELGKIDLLSEHGLYANRSDFIRTAIRQKLETHEKDIQAYIKPAFPNEMKELSFIGIGLLSKSYLEKIKNEGNTCTVTAVGILHVEKDITPALFDETVGHIAVYGKSIASDEIKTIIAQKSR